MQKEMNEVVCVIVDAEKSIITQDMRGRIIADLSPIADRISEYADVAESIVVTRKEDADVAAEYCERIANDIKAVNRHEILDGVIKGFHRMHRRLTALRDDFVSPLENSRKTIKNKIIAWQQEEQRKAEVERARLQAIADEAARKERERLEKEAAKLKTPEKIEQRLEQAAQVIAPVIHVEAPKSGIRMSKAWVAEVENPMAFFAAVAERMELAGYVTIETTKLARAKAANPMIEIPGIEFRQVTR